MGTDRRAARREGFPEHRSRLDKNGQICMKKELLGQHLRGHVLGASAVGVGDLVLVNFRFRQPEVSDLDASV